MSSLNIFFTQQLSDVSAAYIKHLRLVRGLEFAEIYHLVIQEHKELEIKDESVKANNIAKGHSLCTATMFYLNEFEILDKWFW
jgi:hypothetical protein